MLVVDAREERLPRAAVGVGAAVHLGRAVAQRIREHLRAAPHPRAVRREVAHRTRLRVRHRRRDCDEGGGARRERDERFDRRLLLAQAALRDREVVAPHECLGEAPALRRDDRLHRAHHRGVLLARRVGLDPARPLVREEEVGDRRVRQRVDIVLVHEGAAVAHVLVRLQLAELDKVGGAHSAAAWVSVAVAATASRTPPSPPHSAPRGAPRASASCTATATARGGG